MQNTFPYCVQKVFALHAIPILFQEETFVAFNSWNLLILLTGMVLAWL